jgi:DnaJ-class molecular chaperone
VRCYYDVLEISREASFRDIKKSYRKLVFKYHPDRHNDSEFYKEKIQEVNAAYECLSDASKRKVYDQRFSSTSSSSFTPPKAPDIYFVNLSFKESYYGCHKQIKLMDSFGGDYFYTLEIPGGIVSGSIFTIPGNSRVSGFLVRVNIEPDEHLEREGQDLYYTATIPFIKLLMGGTIEIPWMDQIRTLNISPNTPEGFTFNIPKMGMPYPGRPGEFGNLYIHLKVRGMVDFSEALKECFA